MRTLALSLVLFVVALTGCTRPPHEIVIGFPPVESAQRVQLNANAFVAQLQKKSKVQLRAWVASDYRTLVDAIHLGKVHFAFMPPLAYVLLEQKAPPRALLKTMRDGSGYFFSAIVTAKKFKSVRELKGKSIAWTDPLSASGFLIPRASLLEDENIKADVFFGKQQFAGGNDALLRAVVNEAVDAGAVFASENPMSQRGNAWNLYLSRAQAAKIKVLFRSKPIPNDVFGTTEAFVQKFPELVYEVSALTKNLQDTPEGRKVLMDLYSIDAFGPVSMSDYDGIRKIARKQGLIK